jgi:hypothetical protein
MRMIISVILVLLFYQLISAQTICNPEKPKNPKAGRELTLKKVFRITDDAENFYFRSPHSPGSLSDSRIYLQDEKSLYLFSSDGRYLKNLFKPGQGPGEMTFINGFCQTGKGMLLLNSNPLKVISIDNFGTYKSEARLKISGRCTLISADGSQFFVIVKKHKYFPQKKFIFDEDHFLLAINYPIGNSQVLFNFKTQSFQVKCEGGGLIRAPLNLVLWTIVDNKYLILCHTSAYQFIIYDLKQRTLRHTVTRSYNRQYRPVPGQERKIGAYCRKDKPIRIPGKFQDDIYDIFARGKSIWVVTSTVDKRRGTLIDVYDLNGVYKDCFYLKFPQSKDQRIGIPKKMGFYNDFLYVVEKGENDQFSLVKYRIIYPQ